MHIPLFRLHQCYRLNIIFADLSLYEEEGLIIAPPSAVGLILKHFLAIKVSMVQA